MKRILVFMLIVSFACAGGYEKTFQLSFESIDELINVTTDLRAQNLIPEHEYVFHINVTWAVPEEALRGINVDRVVVYVRIYPENRTSFIYFKKGDRIKREEYLMLSCILENDTCSPSSNLSRQVLVYYKIPEGAKSEDRLKVEASVFPFAKKDIIDEAKKELEYARERVEDAEKSGMNVTDLKELIAHAQDEFNNGDYNFSINISKEIVERIAERIRLGKGRETDKKSVNGTFQEVSRLLERKDLIIGGMTLIILAVIILLLFKVTGKKGAT